MDPFLTRSAENLAADQSAAVVAGLLLLLATILAVGIFFLWLAMRQFRERRIAGRIRPSPSGADRRTGALRFQAPLFVSSCRWLAIRCPQPLAVQAALNLHNPAACSWEEGLAGARERKLFISPPIGDWVLVVGSGLPDPAEDVDRCFHLLTGLSRKLGEVQFFHLNRAVQHHAWARLECGRVQRAYAWAGHTLWNQGERTPAEHELRLTCFEYSESSEQTDFTRPTPVSFNAEKVPLLAARWSVDPTLLDEQQFRSSRGIVGDLSVTKPR